MSIPFVNSKKHTHPLWFSIPASGPTILGGKPTGLSLSGGFSTLSNSSNTGYLPIDFHTRTLLFHLK